MPASPELQGRVLALRDRLREDLRRSAVYLFESQLLWMRVVAGAIDGMTQEYTSDEFGFVTNLGTLKSNAIPFLGEQLPNSVLFQAVSAFESFLFDVIGAWLTEFPESLGRKTVAVRTVLETATRDELLDEIVRRELLEIAYGKPADWFEYIRSRMGVPAPTDADIGRIAEAKAARDVLMHNRGVVNRLYVAKSGTHARYAEGEVLHLPEPYLSGVLRLLTAVADRLCQSLTGEAP
jgi:hypothetical protein